MAGPPLGRAISAGPRLPDLLAALAVGGLMTFMLLANSTMAAATSPLFSSLAAHGVGAVAAGLVLGALRLRRGQGAPAPGESVPRWAYLGGLSGAVTVMLTSYTANSELALTGTLALGLAGQVALALLCDRFGLLGLARRRLTRHDALSLGLICAGTVLVIHARGV